jgi:hypothetical protein
VQLNRRLLASISSLSKVAAMWLHPSHNYFCSAEGWACRVASFYCLAALGRRPLCKGCHRLLQFHTAPVVRCVVAPTDAAQRLRWTGWAVTRDVRAHTRDAPRSVTGVSPAYGRSVGSFCVVQGTLAQRTSPPRI